MSRICSYIVAAALLVSSCGAPVPFAEPQRTPESVPPAEEREDEHRLTKSAVVVGGVVIASCLLIAKVRKLCARIVVPSPTKHAPTTTADDTAALLSAWQARHADEVAPLREELATLRKEYEEFRDYLRSDSGRQANINGFILENDTVQALPRIISNLFEGEHVNKIVRNIEGSFATAQGKVRGFEIDAIAVTNNRIFVIETKVTLKRNDIERLAMLLENFHKLKFNDKRLYQLMRKKKHVHGGLSYLFEGKLEDNTVAAKSASSYARQQYQLLTIPRLLHDKSAPKRLDDLRDFRR